MPFALLAFAPEVSRRLPPAPDAVGPTIGGLAFLILVVSLVWWGMRKIKGRGLDGARRSRGGGAIGNALFEMGSVLQPDRPNVEVIVKISEEVHEDDVGDARNPTPPRPRPAPPEDQVVGSGPEGDKQLKPPR